MERLNFRLSRFKRISWTGEAARETWEPRLDRIVSAWFNVEWMSIGVGSRFCAILVPQSSRTPMPWKNHGLCELPLHITSDGNTAPDNSTFSDAFQVSFSEESIAVGAPEVLRQLKVAWESHDHDVIGSLLGYPDCCRRFFRQTCVEEQIIDTTWPMATGTIALSEYEKRVHIESSFISNVLWRWMGVRAVPHLPCRFDCVNTITFGEQLLAIGRSSGYTEEMDWIEEILSWPVEWSALHGIAEVKTPVLKVVTDTDATPHKYTVRLKGQRYPHEGAIGLSFPYRKTSRPRRAEVRRYQRGPENQPQRQ